MKSNPVVLKEYKTQYLDVVIDLKFTSNLTFISDISGTGKTFLWNVLNNEKILDSRLATLNFTDALTDISDKLSGYSGKLIIIDNADIILNDNLRYRISSDNKNQYLIFGRNVNGLNLTVDNMYKILVSQNTLKLVPKYGRLY